MTDFQLMSPRELRTFAAEHGVDASVIDSRVKAQLVGLLTAWESGEGYEPPEPVGLEVDVPEGEPVEFGPEQTTPSPVGSQAGVPYSEVAGEPIDLGEDASAEPSEGQPDIPPEYRDELVETYRGTRIDDQARAGGLREREKAVPPAEPEVLEPLTVDDLIGDNNRVRAHVNSFPMTVDGRKECKLMIVEVPGEDGAKALVWWVNAAREPMLAGGPVRVASEYTDPDTKRHHVVDENGDEHVYYPSGGCSTCGNRLSNWRPWPAPTRIVQVSRRARREPRHKKTTRRG